MASFSRDGIHLSERDRLCAVSLVKRFSGLSAGSGDGHCWHRLLRLVAQAKERLPKKAAAFEGAVESLQSELGSGLDTERRYPVIV